MTAPVIGFAGMTHLGVNSAAAAAARGYSTVWFDPDRAMVGRLESGEFPVVEPGLVELANTNRERISFTSDATALGRCAVVYIACDVPTDEQGDSDLSSVRRLIDTVSAGLARDAVLVVLCQVPPGFTRALDWPVAQRYYQVETLVFGSAVERALHPERFIVGCADPAVPLPGPYRGFLEAFGCPVLPMRYESAELAKIAINCCLVASVTVANTLAGLSERIGADWNEIVPALRLDRRIGHHAYLAPGLGLAGGNLERDLATVLRLAEETGSHVELVRASLADSRQRRDWPLRTLHQELLAGHPDAVVAVAGARPGRARAGGRPSPGDRLCDGVGGGNRRRCTCDHDALAGVPGSQSVRPAPCHARARDPRSLSRAGRCSGTRGRLRLFRARGAGAARRGEGYACLNT